MGKIQKTLHVRKPRKIEMATSKCDLAAKEPMQLGAFTEVVFSTQNW